MEKNTSQTDDNNTKQNNVLEKITYNLYLEQRRSRRWNIFFKLLTFIFIFLIIGFSYNLNNKPIRINEKHIALIEIFGTISPTTITNSHNVIEQLDKAFKAKNSEAIFISINSGGGSPVQSGEIYDEILHLRSKYPEKKTYAIISDIGASGAYYIASAAEKIYANQASLVGSIGVISESFGFVDLIKKVGIERRIQKSGDYKAAMDSFSEKNPESIKHFQKTIDDIHQQFINAVKHTRNDRLSSNPLIYSGLVWNGIEATKLGLIDDIGSIQSVSRNIIKNEKIMNYSVSNNFVSDLFKKINIAFEQTINNLFTFLNTTLK